MRLVRRLRVAGQESSSPSYSARRVADPARQVADYWRFERRTARQGFVYNFISVLMSLISGLTLAAMDNRLLFRVKDVGQSTS
jgi:hypothetical protein